MYSHILPLFYTRLHLYSYLISGSTAPVLTSMSVPVLDWMGMLIKVLGSNFLINRSAQILCFDFSAGFKLPFEIDP